jgi:hypothetical protein
MKKRTSVYAGLWLLSLCLASASSAQSLKPGTEIQVQLLTRLDTGSTPAGQEFLATLAQPLASGKTVWPKGTQVKGKVVEVVSSGRLQRPASISLQLTQIGNSPVETQVEQIDGKSHAGRNVALIGGGAAVGAILGSIAGGGKGAAIGTAVGAGAGTATAAATGKQEIVLAAETSLTFVVPGGAAAPPAPPVERSEVAPQPQPAYRPVEDRPEVREERDDYRDRPEVREEHDDDRDRPEGRQRFRLFFSERDRDVIRDFFRSDSDGQSLRAGWSERDRDLPPGLERQLQRNENLPPGLQRRVRTFPQRLERRLEPLPAGYWRGILAGRAMILTDAGGIVDVVFIE